MSHKVIRVLIADDHALVRHGYRRMLTMQDKFIEIVAEAENGQQAVELAGELRPDVIIMDLSMPVMDGLAATAAINKLGTGAKVLVVSMHGDTTNVVTAFKRGAQGFILKQHAVEALAKGVHAVDAGHLFLGPALRQRLGDYVGQMLGRAPSDFHD
jgi:DNA-binding NarL/FixJ family response regulator